MVLTKEEIDRYLKEKHPELHFKEKKGYPSIRDCYFANVEALEDYLRKRDERLKRNIEILRQNRLEGQSGPITPFNPKECWPNMTDEQVEQCWELYRDLTGSY